MSRRATAVVVGALAAVGIAGFTFLPDFGSTPDTVAETPLPPTVLACRLWLQSVSPDSVDALTSRLEFEVVADLALGSPSGDSFRQIVDLHDLGNRLDGINDASGPVASMSGVDRAVAAAMIKASNAAGDLGRSLASGSRFDHSRLHEVRREAITLAARVHRAVALCGGNA